MAILALIREEEGEEEDAKFCCVEFRGRRRIIESGKKKQKHYLSHAFNSISWAAVLQNLARSQ
eukprot:6465471-Amphidinium_carterae.2